MSSESSEKRLILFTVVTFLSIFGIQYVMDLTGLTPPPPPPAPKAKAQKPADSPPVGQPGDAGPARVAAGETARTGAADGDKATENADAKGKEPAVAIAGVAELTLGSVTRPGPGGGYHLEVQLEQKGAGVRSVTSALYEAEFEEGKPKHRPLEILQARRAPAFAAGASGVDPFPPPSLAMTLVLPRDRSVDPDDAAAAGVASAGGGELPLDAVVWEVVRDDQGRAARPVTRKPPAPAPGKAAAPPAGAAEGQEVVFRTRVDSLGLVITRTYRLFKGDDGFELDLRFESPEQTRSVVYKLLGPHGIPIEGEWYTGTFRDAVFGQVEGAGTKVVTLSAYDIAKKGRENPERFQKLPLRYAGIENQYFASVLEPAVTPTGDADRVDAEAAPVILQDDPENRQKADIGVEVTSRPVRVGPNISPVHAYKVFAGPKTYEALAPYAAEDLSTYRKNNWIPFAPYLAKSIISPLLDWMYSFTRYVSRSFGGKDGNYGVAIILLTMCVRLAMFPIGRKMALSAKKMQDLQPLLKELQEKYKDDKEAQTRETFALYKRHGVNPVGGCLPALIQLPIFVGLWQALNNSVHLRHASFLYIQNLAAPDMLFRFPTTLPLLGDYFNVLPFIVVGVQLVQMQLFSPPATTPEAESQQKMMKYMMVFMAFMFYKVPSGLGIYFITSTLWQITERLLLPKVTHAPATPGPGADDGKTPPGGGGNNNNGGGGRGGNDGPGKPPPGRFGTFMAKVLEEAQKNPTYRNLTDEKDRGERDRDRPGRDKGKPRSKPGRRR